MRATDLSLTTGECGRETDLGRAYAASWPLIVLLMSSPVARTRPALASPSGRNPLFQPVFWQRLRFSRADPAPAHRS